MNLVLFEPAETAAPLPRHDPRARHLLEVLRRGVGDTFDAGLVDGPRGKGTITALATGFLTLTFSWDAAPPPPPDPIAIIVGLPRPQTARDLLRDCTTLGVASLDFIVTDKGDPNYATSSLWKSGEWRRHLVAGAQQAFATRLPTVAHGRTLEETLAKISGAASRLALDNYESPQSLAAIALSPPVALALGPERGWSEGERKLLRLRGFSLVHLGKRVLRTETAAIAALTLVRSRLGLM